jgi:GAF domain-containing protein
VAYSDALGELKEIVRERGIRAGLVFLNARTPHRFTALYRFDGETLHNLVFFDAENPLQESTGDIPVLASYCVFVRDLEQTFSTAQASADDRLGDHPKRNVLQSYCGVPLRDPSGAMFGTICHFNFEAVAISADTVELMEAVAPILKRSLV